MKLALLIMMALTFALALFSYTKGAHWEGLKVGGKMAQDMLPFLILGFIIAGMVRALIPPEMVMKWLGREAGMKGILIASAAGAISPGGPFINFPLVAALYQAGAGVGAPLAGYLAHTFFSGWVGR